MQIIIGAGISGLSAAHNLKGKYIVLEKNDFCGGLSTQYKSKDYWFDYSGHYFHFKNNPQIKSYLEKFSNFSSYRRQSKIYIGNRFVPFPIQLHLSYLPKKKARQILAEFPETPRTTCSNLDAYLRENFGEELFSLFFQPFLDKYYQTSLKNIMATMDKGSIPIPDKKAVIQGFWGKDFQNQGYNPVFYYPKTSLRQLIANMVTPIQQHIELKQDVKKIDWKNKKVFTQHKSYTYEYLINTMPLNQLLTRLEPRLDFPDPTKLKYVSTLVCNVVLKKRRKRFHWVYLAEKRYPFYRVGFYPSRNPPVCYLEKSVSPQTSVPHSRQIILDIMFTLKELGIIRKPDEIFFVDQQIIPVSYIIFSQDWNKIIPSTLSELNNLGIYSIGRYGAWNYTSMSDDIQMAMDTANIINEK
jgi:protoporphyrinogen oxidase